MLIRLFWGCGGVGLSRGPGRGDDGGWADGPRWVGTTGDGLRWDRADGGRAEVGRADGGRHGYPPLSYDVTDAVVC